MSNNPQKKYTTRASESVLFSFTQNWNDEWFQLRKVHNCPPIQEKKHETMSFLLIVEC